MRRLIVLLALVFAAPAAAATIHGNAHVPLIVGTEAGDRVLAGAGNHAIQVAWGGVDSVNCGKGFDVVSADLSDKVAANCKVVSRRLSVDPSVNSLSQHETAVEPDDAAWGSTVVAAYQLGRFETGASSNIGFAVSRDAGRTWQRGVLPSLTVESTPPGSQRAASDPSVAYDAVHGVWLIATLTLEASASHVFVAHSADGLHWSAPVTAATGPLLDKEWLSCDNGTSSPFRGRCYALYTDDQKNITVSQSSDDGGVTWSQPVQANRLLVGTQPVVLADGALVTVAGDYHGQLALTGAIDGFRSTDGGATFTPFTVSSFQAASPGPMRAISLPSLEVDAAGTLYTAWADCSFRPGCTANDLVLSSSRDEGLTWTAPQRVPTAPVSSTQSSFIPGLAADPLHAGRLAIVYAYFLPGSCARGACLLGIAFVQSRDGGVTWTVPQQLDAQPMAMTSLSQAEGDRMVGDYFSAEFADGRIVPVFTLAAPPLRGRFREAIFATSLAPLG
jgi:hypothetical protein